MGPDIAVIIPTYMRPQKTDRAIRSVMGQSGVRSEIVVVDDASPEPFRIGREFDDAGVHVLRLPQNRGPAAARDAGVGASRAPFIAFLDSDDFFLPDTLAPRLAALKRASRSDRPVLLAAAVWRWLPGRAAREFRPIEASSVAALASGCWYFPGSTSLFSRATWECVGPLDGRLRRLEDLDWGIRLGLAGGMLQVTPEPASVIEHSPRAGLAKVSEAAAMLLARYSPGGEQALERAALSRLKAYLALEQASSALGEGRIAGFAANLATSFLHRPRFSLHQGRWWSSRQGTAEELQAIERAARSLGTGSPTGTAV
ncbi:MAG: glycosyltransferase family 2 protein [Hyphomicrobiales bacterium]